DVVSPRGCLYDHAVVPDQEANVMSPSPQPGREALLDRAAGGTFSTVRSVYDGQKHGCLLRVGLGRSPGNTSRVSIRQRPMRSGNADDQRDGDNSAIPERATRSIQKSDLRVFLSILSTSGLA